MNQPHQQLKIEARFISVNGNPERNGTPLERIFVTTDTQSNPRFFNRGNAIDDLIYFLLDNRLASRSEIFEAILYYDPNPNEKTLLAKVFKKNMQ